MRVNELALKFSGLFCMFRSDLALNNKIPFDVIYLYRLKVTTNKVRIFKFT